MQYWGTCDPHRLYPAAVACLLLTWWTVAALICNSDKSHYTVRKCVSSIWQRRIKVCSQCDPWDSMWSWEDVPDKRGLKAVPLTPFIYPLCSYITVYCTTQGLHLPHAMICRDMAQNTDLYEIPWPISLELVRWSWTIRTKSLAERSRSTVYNTDTAWLHCGQRSALCQPLLLEQ